VLRIGAWVRRFILNCKRQPAERGRSHQQSRGSTTTRMVDTTGPRRSQARYLADRERLNLQENNLGMLEYRGRIIGEYPIYIQDFHPFASSLVREAHLSTLHGGVSITMAKICEHYWVPRLRRLVKNIRSYCNGCRRFWVKAYQVPPPGNLRTTRTQGAVPFEVIGVDFAGPIKYVTKSTKEAKSYVSYIGSWRILEAYAAYTGR
jgi:hypothetical protein